MRAFADLYAALDETTKTNAKITAMSRYFSSSPPEDVAWAVHFLIGRRPKRLIPTRDLVDWAIEEAGVPEWLFGESYQAVGDLAETIALLLPPASTTSDRPLRYWVEERLLPMLNITRDEAMRIGEIFRNSAESKASVQDLRRAQAEGDVRCSKGQ